jgi:hypothetical protein
MTSAFIVPCSLAAARAWARGWIGDLELLQDGGAGAVYFCELPDLASFRRALPAFRSEYNRGARIVICRTDAPAVTHHLQKWGAWPTHRDPSGRLRWLAPPHVVNRYFGRMAQKSAAASGVTTSR